MFDSPLLPLGTFNPWLDWLRLADRAQPASADHDRLPDLDLTGAAWELTGVDSDGTDWAGTTITFVSQKPHGRNGSAEYVLSGVIDWVCGTGEEARELFLGTLKSDRVLRLEGFELRTEHEDFVLGVYEAKVSEDGTALVGGRWEGSDEAADAAGWTALRHEAPSFVAALPVSAPALAPGFTLGDGMGLPWLDFWPTLFGQLLETMTSPALFNPMAFWPWNMLLPSKQET